MLFCRTASCSSLSQGSTSFTGSFPGSTSYSSLSSLNTSAAGNHDMGHRRFVHVAWLLALVALSAVSFTAGATQALGSTLFWNRQPKAHDPLPFYVDNSLSRCGTFTTFWFTVMHKSLRSPEAVLATRHDSGNPLPVNHLVHWRPMSSVP